MAVQEKELGDRSIKEGKKNEALRRHVRRILLKDLFNTPLEFRDVIVDHVARVVSMSEDQLLVEALSMDERDALRKYDDEIPDWMMDEFTPPEDAAYVQTPFTMAGTDLNSYFYERALELSDDSNGITDSIRSTVRDELRVIYAARTVQGRLKEALDMPPREYPAFKTLEDRFAFERAVDTTAKAVWYFNSLK